MARRSRYQSDHRDRGDGACEFCFEEWPCAVERGEKRTSGIHEWENDHREELRAAETAIINEQNQKIAEVLTGLGIESVRLSTYGDSVYVGRETLYKIACALEAAGAVIKEGV